MSQNAVIVTTNLECQIIDIQTNSLSQLQSAVKGLIQPIDLHERITMWVNEEFLFTDFELNPFATGVYSEMWQSVNPIYGDVVFTGGTDENGNTLGLTPEDQEIITSAVTKMSARAKELELF